jgi:pimeloyl-ACP methyl ester carboxylesterase
MSTDTAAMSVDPAVRPFHVDTAEETISDLRRRIAAWRPPEREPVDDQSQGVQLATVQDLASYWAAEYDWRRCAANLNTLGQFITSIDGLDIHFIHARSPQQNALPLIVSHGWPGSIIEPLTNPAEHGGTGSDAFDMVIPSLPGYGFSGKPAAAGWGPDRIARAWAVLMERLGYTRYVAQGGDWGTAISAAMARQAPEGLLGIHVNFAQMVPLDVLGHIRNGDPAPAGLSDVESTRMNKSHSRRITADTASSRARARKRSATAWPTHPSASRPGFLTTTRAPTSTSPGSSPDNPSAPSRATTGSTTPRSTGSPTRRPPLRGCTGNKPLPGKTSTPPPTFPSRRQSQCFRRSTSTHRAAGPRRLTTT